MRPVGVLVVVLLLVAGCRSGPAGSPESSGAAAPGATAAAPPVAQRAAHTMTPLADGSLLVAGGCAVDGCTVATASAYVLDGTGARRTADLSAPRDAHTATALPDGRVLVTGGFAGEGEAPLASAELYDPGTGRWTPVGGLAVGRGGHAAAPLGDGRVLVAGGWVGPGTYTASTEVFDPATGRFSTGPALPIAVDGLAATALPDGSVLVAGGQSRPGTASALAVRIRPDGTAAPAGPLRTARFKHALVTLPSGVAVVLGGTPDDRRLLAGTEVFDPAAGRFRPGPALREGRYKLAGAAAVLPDGRVAVAGGGAGIEVLDPRTGTSTPVAAAGRARASFSTAGVSGGRLRVLGGYDAEIRLTGRDLAIPLSGL